MKAMLRLILLMSCSCIIFGGASVFAADTGKLFNKLDADKSGAISREEFVSCLLVRDKEGNIKHAELCANPGAALSVTEKDRLYNKIDLERSGAITRKKLNKFATPDGFAPIRF
jgi:hypothetical protein